MDIRQLKYFLAVAEELHFRRAAERLFIAQPGLSRQIQKLEEELGVPLFLRNNRKVELTPAGLHLRNRATLLLRDMEVLVAETWEAGRGARGHLRVGYIGSAMQRVLPQLVMAVNAEYPDIHFSLREMENPDQLEALLNQELDLGFVRMDRIPAPLVALTVHEDTFSLVLPADHPVTPENFTGLAQFREESFILFERRYGESYYELVMQLFDAAGFTPKVSHNSVNASSIYRLVANGLGISIVPTVLREGYAMRVKFIELTGVPQRTSLRAIWKRGKEDALLQNVITLLNEKVGEG